MRILVVLLLVVAFEQRLIPLVDDAALVFHRVRHEERVLAVMVRVLAQQQADTRRCRLAVVVRHWLERTEPASKERLVYRRDRIRVPPVIVNRGDHVDVEAVDQTVG